jgi:hypothetical protein
VVTGRGTGVGYVSEQGGSNPPAGWYPDPEVPGGTRYWDGSRWGEQRPPTPDPQEPGAGDTGSSGGGWAPPGGGWSSGGDGWASGGSGGGAPGGGDRPAWQQAPGAGQGSWSQTSPAADVDPWFWQSIVATFLCCLPLGIVAIVKSSQAKSAKDVGNAQLAQQRAGEARTWTLVTVGVGLVANTLFFTFGFLGAAAGV